MFDIEYKKLTAATYRQVAAALTKESYVPEVQRQSALHRRIVDMRDSFLNAARCVEESIEALEADAQASLGAPASVTPAVDSLAEAIERQLAEPVSSLEPKSQPSRVNARGQLDEATLWGK